MVSGQISVYEKTGCFLQSTRRERHPPFTVTDTEGAEGRDGPQVVGSA